KNDERSISFTAYKTNKTGDIFDSIVNEMIVVYEGQQYVIKSTDVKYDGAMVSVDVIAKHIYMEFQNHYIQKDIQDEEMNNEDTGESESGEEDKPTMTLEQYCDFGFKGNKLGFSYEIKGKFTQRVAIDELGNKNGMEYLTEGAELFGYIYYADNKKITIYDEATFYELSQEPIIYKLNNDEVQATVTTTDLKTYIQGYGKKKTKTERSEEHTSELQSRFDLVCRLLLEKKKTIEKLFLKSECKYRNIISTQQNYFETIVQRCFITKIATSTTAHVFIKSNHMREYT